VISSDKMEDDSEQVKKWAELLELPRMDKNGQKLLKIMELISRGDGMLNEGALDNGAEREKNAVQRRTEEKEGQENLAGLQSD
jgi:hypothetical protein